MKANKLYFNGELFKIDDNLQDLLQDSLDSSAPNKCIVKRINIDENVVQIPIIRIPNNYNRAKADHIKLGDVMMFLGTSHPDIWMPLIEPCPTRNLMKYNIPITEFIYRYNMIMKRNNRLIDMEVIDYFDEITFILIFKN